MMYLDDFEVCVFQSFSILAICAKSKMSENKDLIVVKTMKTTTANTLLF